MKIEQFEDKGLSHYSYAILSESESKIVLIDPSRNVAPYLDFAAKNEATIIGVIETHPHADFVSGHLELHERIDATIYSSKLVGAEYPHHTFDDGDVIEFGKINLKALNTPGHSPDSISILLEHEGLDKAVFTGDTLFIGDCGRPDLREQAGKVTATREELAGQMYHSLRDKLLALDNEVLVYPAHGAGSLCGKALSDANRSTIGAERISNWSLQEMTEELFVKALLEDQPFVPKYFPYDVDLNKLGAVRLETSIAGVPLGKPENFDSNKLIMDSRPANDFRNGHLSGSINMQNGGKFETWLGSVVAPGESFYLVAANEESLKDVIGKTAKIGYEVFIKSAFVFDKGNEQTDKLDLEDFKSNPDDYTIVDVRNRTEAKAHPIFENAINIPLPELRERALEVPADKPVVVHCAGGYRSAAGSSILNNVFNGEVYDLGENINNFL